MRGKKAAYFFTPQFNIKWLVAITIISTVWVNLNHERWLHKNVLEHDVAKYYSYLPAFFYENDISLLFLKDTVNKSMHDFYYAPNYTANGRAVIKMSMGMAVSYLPFFGVAHIYSKLFGFPTNGYSEPYHFMVLFSSLFYYVIGLIFLGKTLAYFFSHNVVMLTLFILTFATNVFANLTIAGGLAHVVGFCFVSVFLFYTILWHKSQQWKYAILLGLSGGFLMLVRPVNVLILFLFFIYDIKSVNDFKDKWRMMMGHLFQLAVIAGLYLLVFLPQLIYWKYITGHLLFNSYVGEHFYFAKPHVLKALFGFRKGWLIYTPVMVFSVVGFFYLRGAYFKLFFPVVFLFLVYIYVAFSWWCWWYGGCFGQRVLIDIYPVLAIPLAAFLTSLDLKTSFSRRTIYVAIGFFTVLNLFQTMQAKYNILHYDSMTAKNYVEIFGTITRKADSENYLKHPNYEKAKQGEDED